MADVKKPKFFGQSALDHAASVRQQVLPNPRPMKPVCSPYRPTCSTLEPTSSVSVEIGDHIVRAWRKSQWIQVGNGWRCCSRRF